MPQLELDLFSEREPPACVSDITDQATRHAEIRRRADAGLCQMCCAAIDAAWMVISFGWLCRVCEEGGSER